MFIDAATCQGLLELLKRVPVTGTDEARALVSITRNIEMELAHLNTPAALPPGTPPASPAPSVDGQTPTEPTRQQRRAMQAAARKAKKAAAPAAA